MIRFLARLFIKNADDPKDPAVRAAYGILCGAVGIFLNVLLFAGKFFAGTLSGSIAITADAFNNLSDAGSSVITLLGFRLGGQKPDPEHPFGHGRFEYISSLIVSFIILIVGFELLKTSADKVIHPDEMAFSIPLMCILAASVLVKLWMYSYYNYIAKTISSSVMKATARDSLNDVVSTSAVIAATILGQFLPFPTDGIIGVAVALFIMYGGFSMAKETIDLLLGTTPSPELVKQIESIAMTGKDIVGVHDLIVHDYGPGRVFASLHAEVPDDGNIIALHETIDMLERKILSETGVRTVIHMDPVSVNNERVNELRNMVKRIVAETDPEYGIHDFRITDGENNINLIFDLVIKNIASEDERQAVADKIAEKIREADSRCHCIITIDVDYT